MNKMDKLAIGMMLLGFAGIYLSAAASDSGNDIGFAPLLVSMGIMAVGAMMMWLIERKRDNDE